MAKEVSYVVDELLTKPSAVCPTLFVGLGGCGCRMVSRIAKHLRRRPDFEERYRSLVKFALVDTNINDLEAYREIADGTFLISDFEKEEYSDLASGKMFLEPDPYFTQWVPQNYRFRAGDTAGAGQIRIESRLGVFYQMKHKDFVPKFRRLLEQLKSHEHGHRRLDSPEIRIVVCFSVAGGTGSGSHLPIAFMLRDLARELGKPAMIGVAVLPAVFEDFTGINRDGTFANGYAALKEMEHLMKLGAPDSRFFPEDGIEFHYDPSDIAKRVVRQRPFEFVYVVDKPQSFTVAEPVDAAADGLYLQFFSPLYGHQASDYDNYTQHQRFLVPHDFEAKGIVGFTAFYGSYGSAVLLVPVDGLVDYCAQAAALSLMRASFLRSIPGDPVYALLRNNPAPFFEVTLGNSKNEKAIPVSEFQKKEPLIREKLVDRLFMKRVRLLAESEYKEGDAKRFLTLFRHGHRLGEVPKEDGAGFELRPELLKEAQVQLATAGMRYSIGAMVLPVVSEEENQPPGLLRFARRTIEQRLQDDPPPPAGATTVRELVHRAEGWMDEFRGIGMRILNGGYKDGGLAFPGMDSLVALDFLNEEAGDVDLVAKRYAVLSILERVAWERRAPERTAEFDLGSRGENQNVREATAQALLEQFQQQAIDRAMEVVTQVFTERLGDFQKSLSAFVATHRKLEEGFDSLEKEQSKRMEKLREEGDTSTNQYVLDAEALQIEDGRRMWDFYYEDKIANLPELSLGDRIIQLLLSDTVTAMSVRRGGGATAKLEKLFDDLRKHIYGQLKTYIGGDPHDADRERRDGLTLSDALELEVVYRAIYMSNLAEVERNGHNAIRNLITGYRHQPSEFQLQLGEEKHADYLRDKIKRLVKEKASLLCVYEDARDQHGGVRPDHVYLAAIDADFKNSSLAEVIRTADSRLTWVTTGWNNPKEIIFYRAVLNVPLYVFGRMREMKDQYHQFRNLARRPKVLHIDKNWEDSLPDLDPDSSQEKHRQDLLRDHVINFAALLTSRPNGSGGPGLIVRREGRYWLADPEWQPAEAEGDFEEEGLTPLGPTLSDAIEQLPQALEAEKVKYLPFRKMLKAVREGLAPEILGQIVDLPFQWRRNRDELRTQYGTSPAPEQNAKLKDYSDAFHRLQEALEKLLEKLRNRSVEQRTLGEDASFNAARLPPSQAQLNLAQSLDLLSTFSEAWRGMENPDLAREVPKEFHSLFRSLEESELATRLERLRAAQPGGRRA
ncbi:MAG TPA: tubulin-like doman-containing protein [Thermoanaerobaculia bacterium]|nr:tubulin-like doman-containing protein [Thermoanaerobaculia bacterium]